MLLMPKGYFFFMPLVQTLYILALWPAHSAWGVWHRLQGRQSSAMLVYGRLATDLFLVG